jgi:hypothetical protein
MSARLVASHMEVEKTPFPAAMKSPTGPLGLSIQPGMGSSRVGPTIDGRTMATGSPAARFSIKDSASALVNMYVFGLLPLVLWIEGVGEKWRKKK